MIQDEEVQRKKNYFRRYRKSKEQIARLESKYNALVDRMEKVKTSTYTDQPRGGVPVTIDEMISDKMGLEERIKKLYIRSLNIKRELLAVIDSLEDSKYSEILESYFIDLWDFETIADNMGYNTRHIIRLYSNALKKVQI